MPNPTQNVDPNELNRFAQFLQNIDKNSRKSASGLNTFNGRLGFMVAAAFVASPGIASIGVALVSLTGIAGIAAGALAAVAATAATLGVGMSGVGDVFQAAGQAAKSSGAGAASGANQQKQAAKAIEQAKRSLAEAEKNLTQVQEEAARANVQAARQVVAAQRDLVDAQRDAVRAQQRLVQARQDAIRQLQDMRDQLTGNALDERQAVLDVKKAQEDLAKVQRDPTSSQTEREQAILNLEKEQFALQQLRKENSRFSSDQAAAAAKGVAGSQQVVAAQDDVRSSLQSVVDAQQSLKDAQENVVLVQREGMRQIADATQAIIDAQQNLADAYDQTGAAGGGSVDKVAEALARLSPNARAFVSQVLSLQSRWEAFKRSVQDRLFADLAKDVQPLADKWFPLLEDGMGHIADGLNDVIKGIFEWGKSSETIANFKQIFDNTGDAVGNLSTTVRDLLFAFTDIAAVGTDFLPDIAKGANGAAASFRDFIHEARETGKLKQWMQDGADAVKQLWELLKNVASIIGTVFTALDQSGGGALNTLTMLTGQLDDFLKSAEGQDALHALGRIMASIGGALGKSMLAILGALATVVVALEPFITALAQAVGDELTVAFAVLGPVLTVAATALSIMSPTIGPLIATLYLMNKAIGVVMVAWRGLSLLMATNPWLLLIAAVIALVVAIVTNWDAIVAFLKVVWQGIQDGAKAFGDALFAIFVKPVQDFFIWLKQIWTNTGTWLTNKWNEIKATAGRLWNSIKDTVIGAITRLRDGANNLIQRIGQFFRELPGKIMSFLSSLPNKLFQLAGDMIQGLLNGLANLAGEVIDFFVGLAQDAIDVVKNWLGIGSPSKVFFDIGENVVQGLVNGLEGMAGTATKAAEDLAANVTNAASGAVADLSGTVALGTDGSGLPTALPLGAVAAAGAGAPSTAAAAMAQPAIITIDNLTLQVAGNLDPTNPTAFRQTIVRLKDAIRTVDREYAK